MTFQKISLLCALSLALTKPCYPDNIEQSIYIQSGQGIGWSQKKGHGRFSGSWLLGEPLSKNFACEIGLASYMINQQQPNTVINNRSSIQTIQVFIKTLTKPFKHLELYGKIGPSYRLNSRYTHEKATLIAAIATGAMTQWLHIRLGIESQVILQSIDRTVTNREPNHYSIQATVGYQF